VSARRGRDRPVEVEVRLVRQTDAAYLVDDECGHRVWVPRSRCEFDPRPSVANQAPPQPLGTLTLPEGLATEKGLV
jgi:hypothetical protein